MPCYNHEPFVAQAIESVLAQKTTFEVQLVIGDDASTDNSQAIIRSYAERYPDRVKTHLRKTNVGPYSRDCPPMVLISSVKAKYTAYLECDDYWTDPYKLQKQIEFMESRPHLSLCTHAVEVVYSGGREELWPPILGLAKQQEFVTEDLLDLHRTPDIVPCSYVFRSGWFKYPEWFYDGVPGDYVMTVLLSARGPMGVMNEVMAVHRKHPGGLSRLITDDLIWTHTIQSRAQTRLDEYFDYKYHHILQPFILRSLKFVAKESLAKRRFYLSALYALKWLWQSCQFSVPKSLRLSLS